jgi:hypothetical protein
MRIGALIMAAMLCVVGPLIWGCGPSTPAIQTTVAQNIGATNLSILSQVDWKQVATALEGRVGPDTEIVVEGYTKQTAGLEVRIRGGELSFKTTASGIGGKDNVAFMPEVEKVLQRWERADNLNAEQKQQIAKEIADAIVSHLSKTSTTNQATTKQPAAEKPAS